MSTHGMTRRLVISAVAAILLVLPACGSSDRTVGEAEQRARDIAGQGKGSTPVDACALIPAAEVTGLIGPNQARSTVNGGDSSCVWENPDTSYSITLEIGSAGTAASGQQPAADPELAPQPIPDSDGMLLVAGDQVRFAAKDRLCYIQVVTDVAQPEKDRATAVRLAKGVRDKI